MGKGGKQTVGYKYNVGVHAVFCHGPIDKFTKVTVDDREAWRGSSTGGTITIDAQELFGGEDREGGVGGDVDVCMGRSDQTKNAYLLAQIGPDIPAYRGVAAMVFKKFYWGNNPYLKAARARGQRIHIRQNGIAQWYDEKAEISYGGTVTDALVMADTAFPANSSGDQPEAYVWTINEGESLIFKKLPGLTYQWWAYTPFDYAYGITQPYRNDFILYRDGTPGFERYFWTTTSRYATGAEAYADWVNEEVVISVPGTYHMSLEDAGDDDNRGGLSVAVYKRAQPDADLNPAHMIRECLTDPLWGMGYSDDDIDDDSFMAAADTLFDEGMGMSLLWDKQAKLEDFVNEIVRHIDAALFVSRSTGKFVLRLIRADYEVGDLPAFDESNVKKVTNPSRPAFGELINSVTVQFWNTLNGKNDGVTVQDPAAIQMQGTPINQPISYPGFTTLYNAQRAASRDLRALSNPFLSCTIVAGEDARELEVGDVILFSWKKWKVENKPMRITGYALAEGVSTEVRLTVSEDVFATPDVAVMAPPATEWENPSQPPTPVVDQIAFEQPYYELVQALGQSDVDGRLLVDSTIGYVGAAARRPSSAINAKMWTDAGDGFTDVDVLDFCPSGSLVGSLSKTATSASLSAYVDLDFLVDGQHFQIGNELLRLDSFDEETGLMTFGRGVLDTVPEEHASGAKVFFWDVYQGYDPTEYVDGETVNVRLTPASGTGVIQIADAANMEVELDQRAWRPYPPGDLRINGDRYVDTSYEDELTIDWSHRDRLLQTSGELADALAADIGPEPGTTYRVRVWIDDVLDTEEDEIAGTTFAVTPTTGGIARVEVHSKRDDVYSMFAPSHTFPYTSGVVRYTEDGDIRLTEDGDIRVTED